MWVETIHLQYLVAAAEHRSFRRAAIALNIAQPTLSKRIRELENRLGVLLFERTSGGAYPTAVGDEFVVGARRIIADLDRLEARAKAIRVGSAGRLDIGFYTTLSGQLRDRVLGFSRQHDHVDLNIIEDNRSALMSNLGRGSIDLAVIPGEPNFRYFAHLALWSERIMVALPKTHRLAERPFIYWTELKHERFLMSQQDPGPELQDFLLGKLASPGERPSIKSVNVHHSVTLNAIDGNGEITLAFEASSILPRTGVVFREVRDGNGPSRIGFVAHWRPNNESPVLKQFLASLQASSGIASTTT